MNGTKRKYFSVFEFKEEDEAAEPAARRFLDCFRSPSVPKVDDDPSAKYVLLSALTSPTDYNKTNTLEANFSCVEEINISPTLCDDRSCHTEFESQRFARDSPAVYGDDDDDDDDDGDDDGEILTSGSESPSTTASDPEEREGDWESPSRENFDKEINIIPEYVVYGNVFYAEARITFVSDCFRIEFSNTWEKEGNFVLEWELSDLVSIDSHWSEYVGAAHVEIRLIANAVRGVEKVGEAEASTSSIVKVAFPIHDVPWWEIEQKIVSLAQRYRDTWNTISDCGMVVAEDPVEPNMLCSSDYFTEFLEPFEDVIYPKGDPDAVSIGRRDVELLQPDTFINDTIIDFYIKYLENNLGSDDKHKFHFFNSFFFRKLVDLDKDPGSALEGREAFQRVRKWTRKVDIFEKDYIFIPVNYSLHWSLLVICHPGEVASTRDDGIEDSSKVPCILHMDSIKGTHNGLRNLVQSYLWEEWKERHPESFEEYSSKFSSLRFVGLELPQQENSFDCGLFLLHYVELFLEEAPISFNPFKITELSDFLGLNWFEPSEASRKRSLIWKLIYDLRDDSSQKVLPTAC